MFRKAWTKVKKFFNDSETIFWARLQVLGGVVMGTLTSIDYTVLHSNTGLDQRQLWVLAGILAFQGFVTEIARRRRATDL